MAESDPLTPPLEALYWTQYSTWYPIFRKHAPKSTVIDIESVQPELLDWLESDTFVLPQGSGPSSSLHTSATSSSSDDDGSEDEEEEEGGEAIKLEELDRKIREVIEKYDDGPVFPKLNWSAPLDAGFMLPGNSLQCLHPEDVYLLLKSSEFVGRDLEQISATRSSSTEPQSKEAEQEEGSDPLEITTIAVTKSADNGESDARSVETGQDKRIGPQLVLKKWFQLNRSYEFRCFVRSHHLIAISQRDVTFYDHLQSEYLQSQIKGAIWDFWVDVLQAQSEKGGKWGLGDYIFDVYLTKDLGRVWLIDINAWLPRTDPLLFSFDELEHVHQREKVVRAKTKSRSTSDDAQCDVGSEAMVRLRIGSQAQPSSQEGEQGKQQEEHQDVDEEWDEHQVELRILTDRRMQSSGGTGATYSSNMVPKDLVEFAKTSSSSRNGGGGVGGGAASQAGMGVDEIVRRWNDQVSSDDEA